MSEQKFRGYVRLVRTRQERPSRLEVSYLERRCRSLLEIGRYTQHTQHCCDELADGHTFRHF